MILNNFKLRTTNGVELNEPDITRLLLFAEGMSTLALMLLKKKQNKTKNKKKKKQEGYFKCIQFVVAMLYVSTCKGSQLSASLITDIKEVPEIISKNLVNVFFASLSMKEAFEVPLPPRNCQEQSIVLAAFVVT